MKQTSILLLVLLPMFAQAQKNRRNEIGLMTDFSINSSNTNTTLYGVQMKHWVKKNFAWRVSAGGGHFSQADNEVFIPSSSTDTIKSRTNTYELTMAHIGLGLEWQRKFYKKLYFYMGMQLNAGYGQGYTDTLYRTRYRVGQVYHEGYTSFDNRTVSDPGYYVGFSPLFGLKLNLKRVVIGTEFSNYVRFISKAEGYGRTSNLDFNLPELNQRVYISFRF